MKERSGVGREEAWEEEKADRRSTRFHPPGGQGGGGRPRYIREFSTEFF